MADERDLKMGRAINRLRFKTYIWKPVVIDGKHFFFFNNRLFQMVNDIRVSAGLNPMSWETFLDGVNYRDVFLDNYRKSLAELKSLCYGDW